MEANELINTLMPYIVSAAAALLAYLGSLAKAKYDEYIDTKTKRDIIAATVKYVEQMSAALGIKLDEKKNLAKKKAVEWIQSKGLEISEIELDILIEAFVNEFYPHTKSEAKE